jgi:hypothetical protein
MEPMTDTTETELLPVLSSRIHRIWEAYKEGNIIAHNALLADDYSAVFLDGSVHGRKPTQEEIRQNPLTTFSLTKLLVARVTADTALVNYVADVDGPKDGKQIHLRWQVGEVWVKRNGEWKCRYYQPTPY